MENQRWAVVQKVRTVDEEHYDTLQICESLERARALSEGRCHCEIFPYGITISSLNALLSQDQAVCAA